LNMVPVLWIWDNVETVEGFPAGTGSAWKDEEQKELVAFLRQMADTKAKFLLTSRREEESGLGGLPMRVAVPPMPFHDRVQLTKVLIGKHNRQMSDVDDWRPLLQFTRGNPLTITILVGQALKEGLKTREQI